MKALLLFIGIIFSSCGLLLSQDAKLLDSLLVVSLDDASDPTAKIDALNELAYQLRSSDKTQARSYAKSALDFSIANSYKKGEGDSYVRFGIINRLEGSYEESRKYYFKALEIREKLDDKRGVVSTYNNIALTFKNQGKYVEAKEYYEKGLGLIKDDRPSKTKGKLLLNLGTLCRYLNSYEEAIKYLDHSYAIFDTLRFTSGKADIALDKASLYINALNNLEEAEKNYTNALYLYETINSYQGQAKSYMGLGFLHLKRKNYSKALKFYDAAFQYTEHLSVSDHIKLLEAKGNVFNETNQYEKAISNYDKAVAFAKNSDLNNKLASLSYNIGITEQKQNKHQVAIQYFEESLQILDKFPNPVLKAEVLFNLSRSYYEVKSFNRGFMSSAESQNLKDSLNSSYLNGIVLERNVTLLQSENKLLASEQERQQLFTTSLIIGILLLLGLAGITFAGYYQRQKRLEAEREIDHLLTDIELETTYARLEGQDTERKRIAQDLHDGLGSMLSTVKLYFGSIEEKIDLLRSENQEQKDQYEKATLLLDKACDEVRKVAHEMKSGTLSKFGLPAELESLATIIRESKKIEVELLTHQMEERLDNKIETQLYRITQEIISNILKHAKASKITIELNRFEDIISLVIEDNGVGFDLEQAKAKGGMGIAGIEARIKEIDGSLNIDTQIGRGTSISIDVPYENMD